LCKFACTTAAATLGRSNAVIAYYIYIIIQIYMK